MKRTWHMAVPLPWQSLPRLSAGQRVAAGLAVLLVSGCTGSYNAGSPPAGAPDAAADAQPEAYGEPEYEIVPEGQVPLDERPRCFRAAGGAGVCYCRRESDAAFCTRLGRECGPLSGSDNCGQPRAVASCGTCTESGIGACTTLVSHANSVPTSPLARPGYLQSAIDPDFHTMITRVTGDWGTPVPTTWATDGSLSGKTWRSANGGPRYSNDDAWNADHSLLTCKTCVDGGFLFMDGSTYRPLFHRGWPVRTTGEVRWHPLDPSKMMYIDTDATAGFWSPSSNAKTQRYSPSSDGMTCSGASFGDGNGNPSWDGKRIALLANCPDQRAWVVDVESGARVSPIIATSSLSSRGDWPSGQTRIGGVFHFPKGNYLELGPNYLANYVVQYTGTAASDWSVKYVFASGHQDVAVDANGRDVTFNGGTPEMWDGETGAHTSLAPVIWANQYHSSGKLYRSPGWGVSSTDGTGGNLPGEIVAVELKANGGFRRLLHHRTKLDSAGTECSYWHCPFAVPSFDGKRVFYNSDWGDGTGQVHGYVGDVRNLCP